jgi:hypothetical protein
MPQVRIELQFVQQIGDPRPAEVAFHRHRRARRKLGELGSHGRSVVMFSTVALHDADLPVPVPLG